jgi:uncharacterized protein
MSLSFPFNIATRGVTATSESEKHIRELIEVVLFTQPGERVNRPTFGAGASQLVFALNSNELAAATQLMIQGALQQTLGDRISIENVSVSSDDSNLNISVTYSIKSSTVTQTVNFSRQL